MSVLSVRNEKRTRPATSSFLRNRADCRTCNAGRKSLWQSAPEHKIYCEPFIGGAAVLFGKPQAQAEVINDINSEVINFYEVLQHNFTALQAEISISLHSRKLHQHARVIYDNPDMFDRIKRAWAFWYLANVSFGCNLTAGFGYDKNGMRSKVIRNKRDRFTEELAQRIQDVQLECCDALKLIRSRDDKNTLFYIDPP